MAKSQTVSNYRKWIFAKNSLYIGKYAAPVVPAAIVTTINWDEWFAKSNSSLPLGFATLLISIFLTVFSITKKDKIVEKNVSPLFAIALILATWAVTFMFLGNLMNEMGTMLLYTCAGVIAGAASDEVYMKVATQRVKEYKNLVEKNNLSTASKKKAERKAKAEAEKKELEEAQERATE